MTFEQSVWLPPSTRQGVSALFHAVLRCVLSCLYHRPLEEHVDMVAGDFNCPAWRRPCGNDRKPISVPLKKPSPIQIYRCLEPRCSARRMGGCMRVSQATRLTMKSGKYDNTVLFLSPSTLGLPEKDQSCHHEEWTHLALANPRRGFAPRDKQDQRVHLTEDPLRTNTT